MSSKGTSTFIAHRASSVLLLPLIGWFIWGVASHAGADYEAMRAWLSDRVTAVLFAATIVLSAFHMRIGLNEVMEDYIDASVRGVFMTLNTLAALAVAAAGVWAAWRLAF